MIGHRQIEALRKAGYKPAAVFLNIGPAPAVRWRWQSPEREIENGGLPEVWTGDASPATADLRFLRGCRVHVATFGGARAAWWSWWDAVQAAEPAAMFGVEPDGEVVQWAP